MGLLALPDVVVPVHHVVRQIAMVGAWRAADWNIAAAISDGCLDDSSRQLTPDFRLVRRWHHLRWALPEAALVWIVDYVLHGGGRHCYETCQSPATPNGSRVIISATGGFGACQRPAERRYSITPMLTRCGRNRLA